VSDLNDLIEQEHDDTELVPEILPANARFSVVADSSLWKDLIAKAALVSKPDNPLSGNILLEAFAPKGGKSAHIRISATDTARTLFIESDEVSVKMPGAVLLPTKKLAVVLAATPDYSTRVTVVGTQALIRSGRAQWTLQTPTGEALASVPAIDHIPLQNVDRYGLKDALESARVAVPSMGRASLRQVSVRRGWATGADGSRYHSMFIEHLPEDLEFDIPVDAADALIRLLAADMDEFVQVGAEKNILVFRTARETLVAQKLGVGFPEMESLLLAAEISNTDTIDFSASDLRSAIKRVRVNANPASFALSLQVLPAPADEFEGGNQWMLQLSAVDADQNSAQEAIPIQWSGTKARTFSVNHKHLLAMLDCTGPSELRLYVGVDTKQVKLPLLLKDGMFTGFVQQMRGE
jgi:DNA polymerase III sliding clamp (beta) subunit (PCNA family)